MPEIRLQLDPIWSLPSIVIVILLAVATVWLGYRMSVGLSAGRRHLLAGVRLLTVVVLLVGMVRPQLQWISPDGEKAQVWIVADQSRSMSVNDGPGGITRREALINTLDSVKGQLDSLAEEVTLTRMDFSGNLQSVEEYVPESPGTQTAIGAVLEDAVKRHAQSPLASIFFLSDGAQRSVPPRDQDPRLAARELGELGVSVYPIPMGQAASTSAAADVAIEEIQVDPVVFVKKRVPVRVGLRWEGAGGQRLRVRLLMENRSGLKAQESGEMVPIPPSEYSNSEVVFETRFASGSEVIELSMTPELAGEYKIAATVEPIASEVQTRNNTRQTLITVRKGGLRVAYFDIFRTEIKSIRQLNASEKVQIDFQLMRSGQFAGEVKVDRKWFEPGRYDVYIIGDVPAAQMGEENLRLLAERVRDGAGLMMMGGYHTYGAGGYARSPLQNMIPVLMRDGETQPADVFNEQTQIRDDIQLIPTAAGNRHYVTRIDSVSKNEQAWKDLPPLQGATRIQAKSDFVEVLATSATGDHLIVAAETGRSRVMCLAFDQTYLWSQAGFEQAHRRFWRQAVLWLAHKELDTDQPIWVNVTPKAIDPGGRVTLEYGARDEKGQPITTAELSAKVVNTKGEERLVTGLPSDQGMVGYFDETLEPGDYFVEVATSGANASLGFPATTRFLVHDRDLELDHPVVDRALMEEIAAQAGLTTDSQVVTPEGLNEFLVDYIERKPWKRGNEIASRLNLWDGWPILLIFAGLMTLEWILRKKSGLV